MFLWHFMQGYWYRMLVDVKIMEIEERSGGDVEKIRKILAEGRGDVTPEEELSWFIKDRREDVEKNIQPALDAGQIVLMDRYYYSTAAYQGALGFDPIKIIQDNEAFAPKPDLVFLFTTSAETCLQRIGEREEQTSFERADYLAKVQNIFLSFTDPTIRRIDSQPAKQEVHELLRRETEQLFAKKTEP